MNDNEVTLVFPNVEQKRRFMDQLADGFGENYVGFVNPQWKNGEEFDELTRFELEMFDDE